MAGYAGLSRRDVVLEVGAGIGNLTSLLAGRAGKVVAIERDGRLVKILREQLAGQTNVEIVHGDALRIELPKFNKVVANLPYGISSDITFRLLEHEFELAVLMYQREFARRLVAKPGSGDYGRLTVNVYYRANVKLLEEVPPRAFFPEPKVTSTVVQLTPRPPPFEVKDERVFSNVVRALFQHRCQKVGNALLHSFGEVFPEARLSKAERHAVIEQKIPAALAEKKVMDLEPEKFRVIANLLAASP